MTHKIFRSEHFQAILDGIDDGIFISDAKGDILMVNKSVEKTGDKKKEELIGRNIVDLENEGYCSEFATKHVLRSGQEKNIIQKLADGREFVVTASPHYEEGELKFVIACERDITELVDLQEKLSKAEELKKQYAEELNRLRHGTHKLNDAVCASDNMAKTVLLAQKLAAIDSTVLIQGESGSGKEIIADYIHQNSPRREQPFVKVNCGAIPENLLESELFGYSPGAFSGALKEGKKGYFEAANGGTIFLDEVGELPQSLQVKLLRVLQEKTLVRVGDTEEVCLDIRIISATNRRLKSMVEGDKFRQDLYYRLNVTTINVPPLRERVADIIELSKTFLDKYNNKYQLEKKISSKAMKFLLSYDWPGNVRELENLLESLVITSSSDTISHTEVVEYLHDDVSANSKGFDIRGETLEEKVEDYERQLLIEAYEIYKDSGLMAEEFGSTRSTINRKLKKYDIR